MLAAEADDLRGRRPARLVAAPLVDGRGNRGLRESLQVVGPLLAESGGDGGRLVPLPVVGEEGGDGSGDPEPMLAITP